ncbi:MAG: luciferase family protein [Rubrobacteraceae bacterium]
MLETVLPHDARVPSPTQHTDTRGRSRERRRVDRERGARLARCQREIGHIHCNGVADLPVPREERDALIRTFGNRKTRPDHRVLPHERRASFSSIRDKRSGRSANNYVGKRGFLTYNLGSRESVVGRLYRVGNCRKEARRKAAQR